MSELEFLAYDATLPILAVVVPLALLLSVVSWIRGRLRASIAALELLRLSILAVLLFALCQPERVITEPVIELPKITVLWDDSPSMGTRDLLLSGVQGARPISRAEWLATVFNAEALRTALAGRYELVAGPLSQVTQSPEEGELPASSSAEEDPEAAAAPVGGTDLATPLDRALEDRDLRALVLLSDGDWNAGGDPARIAMEYRLRGVPILALPTGSREALPDIELLPLDPPAFTVVGKPLAVPYAIRSAMDRDLALTITLEGALGGPIREQILLPARSIYEGTLTVLPEEAGELLLSASVPVEPGEYDAENNSAEARIEVRAEFLRVLIIESYPRWEYRYLRNAMVRDPGVQVDCLLFHPDIAALGGGPHYLDAFPERNSLSEYDVVFLGDVGIEPGQLEAEQCEMLAGLVAEQAAGLVLIPGLRGYQASLESSALRLLLPVRMDAAAPHGHGSRSPSPLLLTEAGRRSNLTQLATDEATNAELWPKLPGFQWHAAALEALPGSTVLAVHGTRDDGFGRLPLLVTRTHGTGKVLFMGTDGAWRWREGVEDKLHYRFWRQVVRWMAYQRQMNAGELLRLFHAPDRPLVRTRTTLYANALDAAGGPLSGGHLEALIKAPSGALSDVRFEPAEGQWGLYEAEFRAREPGEHELTLSCRETGARLVAALHVAGSPPERLGKPARPEVLEELARISRGELLVPSDLERLAERLTSLPEQPPAQRRVRLWSHPLLGALLFSLLAASWVLRRAVGRF